MTEIENYDAKKSLNESQSILLRVQGFDNFKIKEEHSETQSTVSASFTKALPMAIFTPFILNEQRKVKELEYEKQKTVIEFKERYELDDYILRLFTGWSINELLKDKERLERTMNNIARFRNEKFIMTDTDFDDIKSNLIYDTMYKYMSNEYKKKVPAKILTSEKKSFKDCYRIDSDGNYQIKDEFYDYTESRITEIKDVLEENLHTIYINADIIKSVYSVAEGNVCARFVISRENIKTYTVKADKFKSFCQTLISDEDFLKKRISYLIKENDNVSDITEKKYQPYREISKNFIRHTPYLMCGEQVAEYNEIYNVMLTEYRKMKEPEEILFNLRLMRKFPLDMADEKNINIIKRLYSEIVKAEEK